MFFISSKKLFWFSTYSNFCVFIVPFFFPVSHCFKGWFKKNLKVYYIINCLSKDFITHFVWYHEKEIRCDIETLTIDRVWNKKHFYGKIMQKMCTKHFDPFVILLNNPKQPLHTRNSFKNKIFWKSIIKKP